jgi:hypothetical protein
LVQRRERAAARSSSGQEREREREREKERERERERGENGLLLAFLVPQSYALRLLICALAAAAGKYRQPSA